MTARSPSDRRAPLLAKGTYRVERRVVHTSDGIKTVVTFDTFVCTRCHAASIPGAPRCAHGYVQRWRRVSGLADKMTDAELLAILSADVAGLSRGDDAGNVP